MKTIPSLTLLLFFGLSSLLSAEDHPWEFRRLHSTFYAEGATFGDVDGDGVGDLVYGPHWFPGPDFNQKHEFYKPVEFPITRYSDNFFVFVHDITGDKKNDILVYGFPGQEARLYVNPGNTRRDTAWPMHIVADKVGQESLFFTDIVPGGLPEIVCSRDTYYGYYEAGSDPTKPWKWNAVSVKGVTHVRFGHGMGVGDLNGDGRLDIIDKMSWWEHPADPGKATWTQHRWVSTPYAGGAHILVNDFDGDGDADIVTSLAAHGHGLAWFEQVKPGSFARHNLMGATSTESPYGICFSQLHALAMADIDGDGLQDFVTGKRWKAHNGKDVGSHEPAVVYWFQCKRTKDGVDWVPHQIHDNSGVGVVVTVADINGDGRMDVISGNKMGLAFHIQKKGVTANAEESWKVPGGRPQDKYGAGLSAEEATRRMEAPKGFEVDLITSEPGLVQPIAMTFDARGRIWVIEGLTYPQRAPEGEGKDRILILEDADGNGSFETRKVFAENINLASGIEVGFGGVWVGAAPYLLFIPDKNQDDKPDSDPQILLDGWGYQDTHETLNAFTWGPDGWLYGCQGVFTHSKVGKPGARDSERTPLNACVWRYHPTRHEFEVFAHGTSNPWGVDFNENGDFFVSACVIPHFFHIIQGGRYIRQAGQHFNKHTYTEINTIADHAHYTGAIRDHAFWGANKAARPAAPMDTSALGGGHAHCGLAIYQADEFPASFKGDALFHNLHGHRIVREELEPNGSGYTARHRPDFVLANNHDYIGVGIMQGPDGAVYYSDWVDPQTCHHRDANIWDRTNGRIYRVRYGDAKPYSFNLWKESNAQLVQRLASPNAFFARQAQRVLQERAVDGKVRMSIKKDLVAFMKNTQGNDTAQLRALWTLHATGGATDTELVKHLESSNPHHRGWAIQFLAESEQALSPEVLKAVEQLAATEADFVTRRYLISMLQRLPINQRWDLAASLIQDPISTTDQNLTHLAWYAIEPMVEADPGRAIAMAEKSPWPQLKDFVLRRATVLEKGRSVLMTSMAKARNAAEFVKSANQLIGALNNLPPVARPDGWEEAKKMGLSLAGKNKGVQDAINQLGAHFGDPDSFPYWRSVASDRKKSPAERSKALALLKTGKDPKLGELAASLVDQRAVGKAAIDALRGFPGKETAEVLVPRLPKFPAQLRTDAINLLATRPDMAKVLLKAVDQKEVPASLISPVLLDQFERFKDKEISRLINKHWTRGGDSVDIRQLARQINQWKKKLGPDVMAKANASRGRETYQMICGNCHQLFGEGVALGPDLTGSNRADLGYILENVLAPSAVVGKDYMVTAFTMKDESVVSGMVKSEGDTHAEVAMPGGTTTQVKLSDVARREQMTLSLMPAGVFEALPINQVADLVKYLASPTQVPLPGKAVKGLANQPVPPPAKGTIRLEGEKLAASAKVNAGSARPQAMGGFGMGWSGKSQLWWTGARPGDRMNLELQKLPQGTYDLVIYTTTAKDYGTISVSVNGKTLGADLFSLSVEPGQPISFSHVSVNQDGKVGIQIEITGTHPESTPRYMVGIDRIELIPTTLEAKSAN